MRIAFVAQPFDRMYPPVRESSVALWIYHVARKCASRGHQAIVLANHGWTWSSRSTTEDGVEYIFTRTGVDRFLNKAAKARAQLLSSQRANRLGRPAFASTWHHAGYAAEAAWRARRLECDVVHIMNYSQFVPVFRRVHPRGKVSLHMHCEWLTQLPAALVGPRLEQTDLIIGCSEYITHAIAAKFPAHAGRCVTVPNAAEKVPETITDERRTPVVLYVGRLSPEKGVHDLIRAFHQVLKEIPEARLHLVGGAGSAPLEFLVGLSTEPHVTALRTFYVEDGHGSTDRYLKALEAEAGQELGQKIFLEGQVPQDRIADHYRRAAVVVNPSLSEAFGMSLVEAMMHRIPVVATRIGGMTYTVEHGVTGLLVEPANPNALAAAICDVLCQPSRARRMGEAGRARALEMFSWDKSADLLLQHYESLLKTPV